MEILISANDSNKKALLLTNSARDKNLYGGERGIRTPGGLHLSGFQDRRLKPLDHLSVWKKAECINLSVSTQDHSLGNGYWAKMVMAAR